MTALASLPKDWNPNIAEGRAARADGRQMNSPYGESAAAREWEQGWRIEDAVSEVPLRTTVVVSQPLRTVSDEKVIEMITAPVAAPVAEKVAGRGRGRPPATGRFATRDELLAAIRNHASRDAKVIASDVQVSVPTVLKLMAG